MKLTTNNQRYGFHLVYQSPLALIIAFLVLMLIFGVLYMHGYFGVLSLIKSKTKIFSFCDPVTPGSPMLFIGEFLTQAFLASGFVAAGYLMFYSCAVLWYSWIPGIIAKDVFVLCLIWFTVFSTVKLVYLVIGIHLTEIDLALKLKESSRSLSKGIPLSIDEELRRGVGFHAEIPKEAKIIWFAGLVAGFGYLVFLVVKGSS